MNKRTKIIGAFLAASSIALAVPFVAQARPGGGDSGFGGCGSHGQRMAMAWGQGGHHGGGLLRTLDLSEAQRDKIFELRHALAPQMHEEMKTVRSASQALRGMMQQDAYDEAKVKALTEQRAAAMSRMAQLRLRNQHEIYQLLTAEQREQLQQQMSARQARRGMGPRFMPGGIDG
ncbi:Spy/CpxP family protein refolding chaperone [Nitrogeniibacter mangrovi]|uniref:Spy/CpxP family protein refolding chaperone n=1 Tax=Nitrogeniibacter mangrovi TaxID=2016596 RepID=A0A6C1AZE1_9RHOO|nr:Spy/CpxP family protein refolding chaperone [Nitrogeniibacter mangrovi]QID16722.1 Spy/CpxP family protein refolding chaperone [Nitrogeniibacter mangrovi]